MQYMRSYEVEIHDFDHILEGQNVEKSKTALLCIIYFSPQISNDSYCATLYNRLRNLRGFAIISDASLDSS